MDSFFYKNEKNATLTTVSEKKAHFLQASTRLLHANIIYISNLCGFPNGVLKKFDVV